MAFAALALTLMLSPAPAIGAERVDVAYEAMRAGQDAAAIRQIEANEALAEDDPARLINLGIAYARQDDTAAARTMFEAAANNADRFALETASGQWVDSKVLARSALAMLERGEFAAGERLATAD
ncbi:hypothetical protein [Croceicoccus sp. YJ47]|uniref:hypothetical protein n=1 Tax=Croceicoccus sp. YJ47 TaxID=2798724 RepID=UPI00192320FD|nr:hypothetical protein [Croceicoccus sp. YJ47]QQN74466.1 hypothetical protein JD971_01360 [Croceicoccus sp. YJ47]